MFRRHPSQLMTDETRVPHKRKRSPHPSPTTAISSSSSKNESKWTTTDLVRLEVTSGSYFGMSSVCGIARDEARIVAVISLKTWSGVCIESKAGKLLGPWNQVPRAEDRQRPVIVTGFRDDFNLSIELEKELHLCGLPVALSGGVAKYSLGSGMYSVMDRYNQCHGYILYLPWFVDIPCWPSGVDFNAGLLSQLQRSGGLKRSEYNVVFDACGPELYITRKILTNVLTAHFAKQGVDLRVNEDDPRKTILSVPHCPSEVLFVGYIPSPQSSDSNDITPACEIARLRDKLQSTQTELTNCIEEGVMCKCTIDQLETRIEALKSANCILIKRVSELGATLSVSQAQADKSAEEIKKLHARIEELTSERDAWTAGFAPNAAGIMTMTSKFSAMIERTCSNWANSVTCVACMARPRCMVVRPCGHLCCCEDCMDKISHVDKDSACPICRAAIVEVVRVFS